MLSQQAWLQRWEVGVWWGWSLVCPVYCPQGSHWPFCGRAGSLNSPLTVGCRVEAGPPQQQLCALPAVVTTLTPDLLTGPEVVQDYCRLLIEVGAVSYLGRGPWCFYNYCSFLLPPTLFCRLAHNVQMRWQGSAWSFATSNTGARGPPVRSCSSGWGASTGGGSFLPWPWWVFTQIVTYVHVFYCWQVCTSSLLFCRAGLIWRSPPRPSRWSPSHQEPFPCQNPCFR